MFEKIVAIEPLGLNEEGIQRLKTLAKQTVFYPDTTLDDGEIAKRIADADCALVSYTSRISGDVIRACKNLKYIGMCCSLYDESSANVDIAAARQHGIVVTGIRDYGDNGVVEFIVSELVRLLHGFGEQQWKALPHELYGLKVGIIGMGTTGIMTARALKAFGAEISYFSRTRKPEIEKEGFAYLPLHELLETAEVISTHLNRNTILLHEEEFELFGSNKILLNTAIGPCFDVPAIEKWLEDKSNFYICDPVAMNEETRHLALYKNVLLANKGSGGSVQTTQRLTDKVLQNMEDYLLTQA